MPESPHQVSSGSTSWLLLEVLGNIWCSSEREAGEQDVALLGGSNYIHSNISSGFSANCASPQRCGWVLLSNPHCLTWHASRDLHRGGMPNAKCWPGMALLTCFSPAVEAALGPCGAPLSSAGMLIVLPRVKKKNQEDD